MPRLRTPRFSARTTNSVMEILVYEQIGANWDGTGVSVANVKAKLDGSKYDSVHIRINSPGGDAFEGVAIKNLLQSTGKPVLVTVDGLAASAASIIAMAGDRIEMGEGSMLMIHNAWSLAVGDAREMRKTADTREKVSDTAVAQS